MVQTHVGPDVIVLVDPSPKDQVTDCVRDIEIVQRVRKASGGRFVDRGGHSGVIVIVVPAARFLFEATGALAGGSYLAGGVVKCAIRIITETYQLLLIGDVIVVG